MHHVQGQRGLAVLVGGEVLRLGGWNGFVAQHDALDQPPHGLDAQRQRNHVEQEQITARVVAGELIRLNRRTQRDHFVRVEVVQRRATKKVGHRLLDLRHAGRAADHHHTLDVVLAQPRIAQRLAHRSHGALCQLGGEFFELLIDHFEPDVLAANAGVAGRAMRR